MTPPTNHLGNYNLHHITVKDIKDSNAQLIKPVEPIATQSDLRMKLLKEEKEEKMWI